MLKLVDRFSELCAKLAAWAFVAVGAMITYEVIMRYVFISPTIWAEEMSRFFQIWATYLAAAYLLRNRSNIAITMIVDRLRHGTRKFAESFFLLSIAGISLVAIVYGTEIAVDSIVQGRSTSSMLAVPKWMTESAIPVGFFILLLQCCAELLRLWLGKEPPRPHPQAEP